MTTRMAGISTKVAGFGVVGTALNVVYWLAFTTTWWPTITPAPPEEIWFQFSVLVAAVVAYFIPELAPVATDELPEYTGTVSKFGTWHSPTDSGGQP